MWWAWILSLWGGYKISEKICGPWVDPNLFNPPPYSPPPHEPEHHPKYQPKPQPPPKKLSAHGIIFDEDMKHLGD